MTCHKCGAMMLMGQCEDFGILFDQYKCYQCGSVAYPDTRQRTKRQKMLSFKEDGSNNLTGGNKCTNLS